MTHRPVTRTDLRGKGRPPCPVANLVPNRVLRPGEEPTSRNLVVFREALRYERRTWGRNGATGGGLHGARLSLPSGMPGDAVQRASREGRAGCPSSFPCGPPQTDGAAEGDPVFAVKLLHSDDWTTGIQRPDGFRRALQTGRTGAFCVGLREETR